MCEPISLSILGTTLTAAQVGTAIAGGVVGSRAVEAEADADASAASYQSHLEHTRAGQVHESASIEKQDLARRQRAVIGRGRTVAASSGIMLESRAEASPNVWESDAKAELAYEGDKIMHNANLRAWGHQQNALVQAENARTARRLGKLKSTMKYVEMGANLIEPTGKMLSGGAGAMSQLI